MRHYERTEEKKKRRGIYSEIDLYEYQQAFGYTDEPDWWYTGEFDHSSEKNILIDKYTSINKMASRVYKIYRSDNRREVIKDLEMKQIVNITLIKDPVINISLDNISKGCTIDYSIIDNEPTQKFIVTEKLNGTVVATKPNSIGGSYNLTLVDEQILPLQLNSQNNITIEISTEQGGLVVSKTATFTRTNNKPTVLVSSYNSNSAKFTVSDLDNNLSKIEWHLDDVLKETITTDLYAEKTINYELTDNAIHTLKIVATDTENATVEKVLSISKEIMPLQSDATLQDISTKLVEIGEGFKNGKTSIINTLALKNIEASLNNTLVELSEKIKTSFDSGDANIEELQNRITELTNQLSQRVKFATGTYTPPDGSQNAIVVPTNLNFVPKTIYIKIIPIKDGSNPYKYVSGYPCVTDVNQNLRYDNGSYTRIVGNCGIREVTANSFKVEIGKSDFNVGVEFPFTFYSSTFRWYALDIDLNKS